MTDVLTPPAQARFLDICCRSFRLPFKVLKTLLKSVLLRLVPKHLHRLVLRAVIHVPHIDDALVDIIRQYLSDSHFDKPTASVASNPDVDHTAPSANRPDTDDIVGGGVPTTNPTLEYDHNPSSGCIINGFRILGHIADGAFGRIVYAHNSKHNAYVAVKIVDIRKHLRAAGCLKPLTDEVRIMNEIHSAQFPFLVPSLASWADERKVYMIMPAMRENLYRRIIRDGPLEAWQVKHYMAELVVALYLLHRQLSIIHRDIKPENIYLDHLGHVHLGDYGLASVCRQDEDIDEHRACSTVGTPGYVAPEVLREKGTSTGYSCAVDVWSLGVIFLQMLLGDVKAWPTTKTVLKVKDVDAQTLLLRMLYHDPKKRIEIVEITEHLYFKDIDFKLLVSSAEDVVVPPLPKLKVYEPPPLQLYMSDALSLSLPERDSRVSDNAFDDFVLTQEDREGFRKSYLPERD